MAMKPAPWAAMRRYLYAVVIFFAMIALIELDFLAFGKESPISVGAALAVILGWIGMTLWMVWFWRPVCPHCRSARAKFICLDRRNERLVCAACGFDEPTGWAG